MYTVHGCEEKWGKNGFPLQGMSPSCLSSDCGRSGKVMTSLPSMIYTTVCVKEWDIWTNTARKEVCSFLYPSPWVYVWIAYKILIWNTWYMMHVLAWTYLSLCILFFWEGYLPLLTCLYVSPLPVKHGGYSFYRGLSVIRSPLRFPYFSLYGSANWFQTFWVAS